MDTTQIRYLNWFDIFFIRKVICELIATPLFGVSAFFFYLFIFASIFSCFNYNTNTMIMVWRRVDENVKLD